MNKTASLSEEFSSNLLTLTRDAILITDLQRRILFASHTVEAMLGYPADQLVGLPLDTLLLKEDLTYFVPNIYTITQERGTFQGEVLLVSHTGESLYGHLTAYLYQGKASESSVVILSIHDISLIKELEKNYVEFKKLNTLGSMTETIMREMRIPILSISGFAERMDRSLPADSPLRNYLAILQNEILSLEAIVSQVEELASLPQPEYTKDDLVEVLQALIEEGKALGNDKRARASLKVTLQSQERTLYMDRSLLNKALNLLLDVTLDTLSMDAGLALYLHASAEYFMIDIHSAESSPTSSSMTALFDSFFTSKPQLGKIRLVTARRIIEDQGGKLEFFSSPEEGAFCRICLIKDRRRKIRRQLL